MQSHFPNPNSTPTLVNSEVPLSLLGLPPCHSEHAPYIQDLIILYWAPTANIPKSCLPRPLITAYNLNHSAEMKQADLGLLVIFLDFTALPFAEVVNFLKTDS